MISNSNMMISIILLCLLAAIGVITALVLRKRRRAKAHKKTRPARWNRWEPRKLYTDDTVKLGWGMITAGWLLVLSLLYIFFDQWMERQNNPNRDLNLYSTTGAHELVLKRNRSGHYVAPGTINGKPVTFMLDTGATLVSVPAHQGATLGLKPGAYGKSQTANGIVDIRFTKIESLTLGPFHLREVRAALNPGMNNDNQVLLGMSVLKHLEFTQSGRNLILRPHTP